MLKKISLLAFLIVLVVFFYQCTHQSVPVVATAAYTGSAKCQSCHEKEFALYKTSNHYHAMDTVSESTVLGNFNNSRFVHNGDTAFFYRRYGNYFVRTTDSIGIKKEFKISYTFGWNPLQQYLVQFDDGRLQVLPFCWDAREKEKGGQRWYHLYGKEKIAPGDELFWMGINQNWNYMCADCHTTDFKKNYDLSADKFKSSWLESRVSCESCHGPGSAHLQWAEKKDKNTLFKGFAISLKGKPINWQLDPALQTTLPQTLIKHDTLIETCARCHARATRFSDNYFHGQSLLQSHLPATADPVNYYIDGQIKEENYEYGSFLQSKMYAKGVTCSNCHEPHSMKVLTTGNALCTSCHMPAKYDGPQHSFHQAASTGNQCVSCHMPTTTYMGIDARHDHSIRIPRPDQSLTMNTPNACNKCHTDKSVGWAATAFTKWYSGKPSLQNNTAGLMHAVSRYIKESEPSLYELLQDKSRPAIIRATALEQYGYYTTSRISTIVFDELKSDVPMLRLHALKALANYAPETIVAYAAPLLTDKVAAIRMEAMNLLSPVYSKLGENDMQLFNKVKEEYLEVQEQMSHRPEGFFNRALILKNTGSSSGAEELYLQCVKRFPTFVPAYSNVIDMYREQNREQDARNVLDIGLRNNPGNGHLHYALGLWYIRRKQNAEGFEELKKAAVASPSDVQIQYSYAIGLFSMGRREKALELLESFSARYGHQPLILDGIISISQDMGRPDIAEKYTAIRKNVFGL
jgi:tetratricopeptide (TPR) repeat protein